jgi:MoaA/NifB/PqqE/SkfB family radical SAM enzyme
MSTSPLTAQATLQLPTADALLRQLSDFSEKGVRKPTFLRTADAVQRALYADFKLTYGNDRFAKLLALKVVNLAVSRYHFLHRHTILAAKPLQLMVDPSNGCQLRCPGCVHSANPDWRDRFEWPNNMLPKQHWQKTMDELGPYAFSATLYNYGEPLLNKNVSAMIAQAKQHQLFTWISSNLSLKYDYEGLVRSGLDYLTISADGATPEVYSKYRRKGDLNLVIENVKRLVAEKRRLGTKRPFLLWQFLTFEHNLHEVDAAIELARDLGVDEVLVATPFDVSIDDGAVKVATSPREGRHTFTPWEECAETLSDVAAGFEGDPAVDAAFERSWYDTMAELGGLHEPNRGDAPMCKWLYENLTLDGAGRLMPCCMSPTKERHLVFGNIADGQDMINTPDAVLSRLAFADRAAYERAAEPIAAEKRTFCADCKETSTPMFGATNAAVTLHQLDFASRVSFVTYNGLSRWD